MKLLQNKQKLDFCDVSQTICIMSFPI